MSSTSPSPNPSPATFPPISPAASPSSSSPPPPANSSTATIQPPPPSPLTPLPPAATSPQPTPAVNSPPNLPSQPPLATSPPTQPSPIPPSDPPPPHRAKIPPAKPPKNSPQPPPPPSNKKIIPGSTLVSPPPPSVPIPAHDKPTSKSAPSSNITSPTSTNARGMKPNGAIAIGITVGFLALTLLAIAIWFTQKRKKRLVSRLNNGYIMPSPRSDSSLPSPKESIHLATIETGSKVTYSQDTRSVRNSRPWFTYEELADVTNRFSTSNLLGEGGFGSVYKGHLPDGREVAVKKLKIGGGQGDQEFTSEVEIISRVHHRHLVSLVGYCIYENQRLLVYDYVPNNTLHYHLHGEGRAVVMDFQTRVKVAAGAARGIAYLHEDCHPRIIHRDIKSSNILLDNNFDALVADFGLAKLTLDTYTHITTRVMGTFGYVAPEYASSGKLSEKSDVYSFGVVLLELITGRKPVDSSRQESLVEWARPLLKRAVDDQDFEELVDPKMNNDFVKLEMFHMIEAASACVRHLASKRPRMSQVVRALDSIFELPDISNGMKPGQSEDFEAREHSAQIRILQRMAFGNQDYSSEIFSHSQNSWMRL